MQLGETDVPVQPLNAQSPPADPRLLPIARVAVRAGSRLGEELILPWALGGLPDAEPYVGNHPEDANARAYQMRDNLVTQVWGLPVEDVLDAARSCMTTLLGPDPSPALAGDRQSPIPPIQSAAASLLVPGATVGTR